jgi:hypothetical protein
MTEPYLTTVLEEAEHVAEQHDQVGRTTDNEGHEYLRYAVFRVFGKEADHSPANWSPIDGVTVGYGKFEAKASRFSAERMSRQRRRDVRPLELQRILVGHRPPQKACTRFRYSSRTSTRRFPVTSST